jgi:hypothetical protein
VRAPITVAVQDVQRSLFSGMYTRPTPKYLPESSTVPRTILCRLVSTLGSGSALQLAMPATTNRPIHPVALSAPMDPPYARAVPRCKADELRQRVPTRSCNSNQRPLPLVCGRCHQ